MKVISILNLKGGVGKTMTAIQMGYILHHRHGYRVLLVDNDKQGNLSRAMKVYESGGRCQTDRLLSGESIGTMNVYTAAPGLGVVNANMSLLTTTYRLTSKTRNYAIRKYETLLEAKSEDGKPYDYIIIDNPPDLGLNVINALMITNDVIIPIRIDQWALEGMEVIQEQIEDIKRFNHCITRPKILVTMYRNDEVNISGIEWLEAAGYKPCDTRIRCSSKVAESTLFGTALEEYSPRSAAAVSYRKFVKEYLEEEKNEGDCNGIQ